jgi:hypothetical protein
MECERSVDDDVWVDCIGIESRAKVIFGFPIMPGRMAMGVARKLFRRFGRA